MLISSFIILSCLGKLISQAVMILIMSTVPPTALLKPSSITAVPNDTITFTCSPSHAEGMVDIAWFSQGAVLLTETNVNSSSLVFKFPSDKDVVWVECVMRNSVGCDHATAVITVPGLLDVIMQICCHVDLGSYR